MRNTWTWRAALALCVCGAVSACAAQPPDTAGPAAAPAPAAEAPAPQYGRSLLSAAARTACDSLCALAEDFDLETVVELPPAVDQEEAAGILTAFYSDNPQHYWADPYLERGAAGALTLGLRCGEGMALSLAKSQRAEIERIAGELLRDLPDDVFAQAVEVHDRLARHTGYNPYSRQAEARTIYGSLVSRSAICDGYARAYQYLMQSLDIPCMYITGDTARGLTHAWNAVRLEGDWYYVDMTWDDRGHVRHDYCLVGLEEMEREHRWDGALYPYLPAGGAGGDYFARNGCLVRDSGAGDELRQIAEIFSRQLQSGPQRTSEGLAYLELRVEGPARYYGEVKERYIRDLLPVVEETFSSLPPGAAVLDTESPVTCDSNDEMQVLTLCIRLLP